MKPSKERNAGAHAERECLGRKLRRMKEKAVDPVYFAAIAEVERWRKGRAERTKKPGGVGRK